MKVKTWKIALVVLAVVISFFVHRYRQPRFIAGERAPDFTAVLANGQTARLTDLRGQYVLLQFWGSWCGPCRAENPHLVRLYQRYHRDGFEIFSVAIERNRSSWQRAIESDGLLWPWHTVESGQFNGEIARLFNIHSIPTTFLLNPEGRIMGVNLSPDQLEKMLETGLASR